MNRVLLIAFHYPPCAEGSGVLRTLKFSRYLSHSMWEPIVLTASTRAYGRVSTEQIADIPARISVTRAFALDTVRHLSVRGSYLRALALPDRWASWWVAAVPAALRLIRRHRPNIIWSTYPIATAHLVAMTVHALTRIPWVADFRDSMTEDNYPRDPLTRAAYLSIERRTVARAARLVFTAESTRRMYLERYPDLRPDRCLVIPNGYDEADFRSLRPTPASPGDRSRALRLVHSGLIYREERDPSALFRALSRLKRDGKLTASVVRIGLRASGFEDHYAAEIRRLAIDDLVELRPPLPYHRALQECLDADALLLLQGASCNHQIPAKAYEYLRVNRPILALTAHEGDTAALLRHAGGATIVALDNEEAIYAALPVFLAEVRSAHHPLSDAQRTYAFSRERQAIQLADALTALRQDGKARGEHPVVRL